MGSIYSRSSNSPSIKPFKVTNTDDQHELLTKGYIVVSSDILIYEETMTGIITQWSYRCICNYGYEGNMFFFEVESDCTYNFSCKKVNQLFQIFSMRYSQYTIHQSNTTDDSVQPLQPPPPLPPHCPRHLTPPPPPPPPPTKPTHTFTSLANSLTKCMSTVPSKEANRLRRWQFIRFTRCNIKTKQNKLTCKSSKYSSRRGKRCIPQKVPKRTCTFSITIKAVFISSSTGLVVGDTMTAQNEIKPPPLSPDYVNINTGFKPATAWPDYVNTSLAADLMMPQRRHTLHIADVNCSHSPTKGSYVHLVFDDGRRLSYDDHVNYSTINFEHTSVLQSLREERESAKSRDTTDGQEMTQF